MAFLASALLWDSCVSTPRTGLGMSIYLGTAPRDGPFVYQRYLELARVTEGRTPKIGLTVSQHCLSPGPPSHHLALLSGTIPEVAVAIDKSWVRVEKGEKNLSGRGRR